MLLRFFANWCAEYTSVVIEKFVSADLFALSPQAFKEHRPTYTRLLNSDLILLRHTSNLYRSSQMVRKYSYVFDHLLMYNAGATERHSVR
jgi:hypothetical protein